MTNSPVTETSEEKEEANTTAAADSDGIKEKTRERDEKEESLSSTGSDGGKGNSSGSGSGGYNADCSSSDASSNNDAATRVAQKQMTKLAIDNGAQSGQGNATEKDPGTSKTRINSVSTNTNAKNVVGTTAPSRLKSTGQSSGKRGARHNSNVVSNHGKNNTFQNVSRSHKNIGANSSVEEVTGCLPQWNGIKIVHPMDPRIDLSTVGFSIGGRSENAFFGSNNNKTNNSTHNAGSMKKVETNQAPNKVDASNGNTNNIPSVEQYTNLLESVRPFFCAHGIATQSTPMAVESSKESKLVRVSHAEINTAVGDLLNTAKNEINTAVGDLLNTAKNELAAAYATAAAAAAPQDDENDKDSSSMVVLARPKRKHSTKQEGTDSNSGRSASSSEEEVREQQQQQQQQQLQKAANDEDVADDENGGENQVVGEDAPQQPQEQQDLLGAPQRYGMSTMVSEYSSSNRNTSGSGSGGNTGSGTGSGSNQGGSSGSGPSSGSGNDQGGISSNGNGSSGSGNDKGSSEEMMDNNGETNSTENSNGNSDEKSPKNTKTKFEDNSNITRFSSNPSEPSTQRSHDQNAAREKKLQDKKRKRMNMRRVYEDQMELDMGSSESSFEQGVLRPGKPVTLDNAISFTKTAKLVIKANPSLTVIHTNAAYTRLSGIDAHEAVGNPVTSLLSLPRQQLSQLDYKKDGASPKDGMEDINEGATDDKNHAEAEAAGRARAAASRDDSSSMESLKNLIVVSGNSKVNEINIRCKPHKMLGRNVKTFKSMAPMKRNQEEGSNGSSSITSSYDGPYAFVACNMSISPVVSSPEIYTNLAMTNKDKKGEHHHNKVKRSEKDHDNHQQKAKRRKHHHTMNDTIIHNRKRQVVSHYVIHMEPLKCDTTQKDAATGSQSSLSTDGEARMETDQRVIPSTVNTGNQNAEGEKEGESGQKEVSTIA